MVFWKKRTGKKTPPVRQGVRGGYWKKVFCGETRNYLVVIYRVPDILFCV